MSHETASYVVGLGSVGRNDVARVGGKNASLGEMIRGLQSEGVSVPPGFATTSEAYWQYVEVNNLEDEMEQALDELRAGKASLTETGARIRRAFLRGDWPAAVRDAIREEYFQLSSRFGVEAVDVAVRSSATAEDLVDASFAGQQESFLNIVGEQALLEACRRCYASLFTDRAISYRQTKGFDHLKVALSIGAEDGARGSRRGRRHVLDRHRDRFRQRRARQRCVGPRGNRRSRYDRTG